MAGGLRAGEPAVGRIRRGGHQEERDSGLRAAGENRRGGISGCRTGARGSGRGRTARVGGGGIAGRRAAGGPNPTGAGIGKNAVPAFGERGRVGGAKADGAASAEPRRGRPDHGRGARVGRCGRAGRRAARGPSPVWRASGKIAVRSSESAAESEARSRWISGRCTGAWPAGSRSRGESRRGAWAGGLSGKGRIRRGRDHAGRGFALRAAQERGERRRISGRRAGARTAGSRSRGESRSR